MQGKFTNGDEVRVKQLPGAGLVGVVGGTDVDTGKVEVVFDGFAPARIEDSFYNEADLELVKAADPQDV